MIARAFPEIFGVLVVVTQREISDLCQVFRIQLRTNDPVRMYLREMSSVELLSRESETAIAKRIEAGREGHDRGALREPTNLPGHHHLAG